MKLRGPQPFPIGEHGRQRRGELPHLAGERALALRLEGAGDLHPTGDHGASRFSSFASRQVADRAGVRQLAYDAVEPLAQRF